MQKYDNIISFCEYLPQQKDFCRYYPAKDEEEWPLPENENNLVNYDNGSEDSAGGIND